MKHIILIGFFIAFFLGGLNTVKACGSDEQCYDEYLQVDQFNETYTTYYYK